MSECNEPERIFIRKDEKGNPVFATAKELVGQLWGSPNFKSAEELRIHLKVSEKRWRIIAGKMADEYRKTTGTPDAKLCTEVNKRLVEYALAVPGYCNGAVLKELDDLTSKETIDLPKVKELLHWTVLSPAQRALLLNSYYQKVDIAKEFAYLVDSSFFAYARGNVVAAYLTLLPCIEGFLLRWRGHDTTTEKPPALADAANWIRKISERNPLAKVPQFADSWADTCAKILGEHLFKNTQTGDSVNNFNRHLALHSFANRKYCTPENYLRAFLLLDLLVELYICEKNIPSPIFLSKKEEWAKHSKAYQEVMINQISGGAPEELLFAYDEYSFPRG